MYFCLSVADCFDWELEKDCNVTYNGTWVNAEAGVGNTSYLSPNITCYTEDMYSDLDDSAIRLKCNETKVGEETIKTCWNESYNPFREELDNIVAGRVFSPEEYFK